MNCVSTEILHESAAVAVWPDVPYKGLHYFHAGDAPLFCEREDEAAECVALVGHYETRILLLHGRSGVGKSSFLRAGLVPALERQTGFCFLHADPSSRLPTFIRCTANPVERIRKTIDEALHLSDRMQGLKDEVRENAKRVLKSSFSTGIQSADAILQTLQMLSGSLKDTLVVVVDQCEEVITLRPTHNRRPDRDPFFYLLEELCLRNLDVRMIVTLRTEYFGQFCDSFRVNPTSKLAPVRAGLEPFMLSGIREEVRIKNAILRPTLTARIGNHCSPRDWYKFEYGPGVVEQISHDLIEHCGESSILPILQIVCKNLYESAVIRSHRAQILMEDYVRLGKVQGTLDTFIDRAISGVLDEVGCPSDRLSIDRWRHVLATLVGRQEGGSVTTLIKKESVLVGDAHDEGLTHEVKKTLEGFAEEKWGLLREITVLEHLDQEEPARNYSLGHDALALALCQWKEAYEQVYAERRRANEQQCMLRRRTGYFIYGFSACVALLVLLILSQHFLNQYRDRKEDISRIMKVDEVSVNDFRQRLLLFLAALQRADGVLWSYVFPIEQITERLKDTLVRSPVFGDNELQASGLDESGKKLALLDREGRVSIYYLDSGKSETSPFSSFGGTPSWTTSIGFVKDMKEPVLVRDGVLYFEGAGKDGQKIDDLIPDELRGKQFVPDIAAGEVRIQFWDQNQTSVVILRTEIADKDQIISRVGSPESANRRFVKATTFVRLPRRRLAPTLSDVSDYSASLERDENDESELTLRSLSDPNLKKVLGELKAFDPLGGPSVSSQFIRSLAFSQDGSALASRASPVDVEVFPLDTARPKKAAQDQHRVRFQVPRYMQHFTRPPWSQLRPPLAVTKLGPNWRFAWLVPQGLVAMEALQGEAMVTGLLGDKPLLTGMENGSRVNFSEDGRFLTIQQRVSGRNQIRVFDLSDKRTRAIFRMKNQELRDLACATAAFGGSRNLTPLEKTIFLGEDEGQLCD
jgi:hypothetical protein